MWASVQTVRGCPKHCSFCSVWRTDGQKPRSAACERRRRRRSRDLRRRGFRFIALADDNFYPVTKTDLAMAARRAGQVAAAGARSESRDERFELMRQLAELPDDMVFFTQITMEAAEDPEFLDAMRKAHIRGALVGVESVTPEGLKDDLQGLQPAPAMRWSRGCGTFRDHGVHVLGSFIFGLPSDTAETFDATRRWRRRRDVTFAQFVLLHAVSRHDRLREVGKQPGSRSARIDGVPLTRHWLMPRRARPKIYMPHPTMSAEEIRQLHAGDVGSASTACRPSGSARSFLRSMKGAAGVRADLEAVPADVRQHRHRHRQRPARPRG